MHEPHNGHIYVCKENELWKYSLKFKNNLNTQRNQCKGIEESRVNNDICKGKWGNIFHCMQTQKTNIYSSFFSCL